MFFSSILVRAQMLSELEEIIAFKQFADQPERQQVMRKTWMKRQVDWTVHHALGLNCVDYKVVSQTLRCGKEYSKFVLSSWLREMTPWCGSNFQIFVVKTIVWLWQKKPLILYCLQRRWVLALSENTCIDHYYRISVYMNIITLRHPLMWFMHN